MTLNQIFKSVFLFSLFLAGTTAQAGRLSIPSFTGQLVGPKDHVLSQYSIRLTWSCDESRLIDIFNPNGFVDCGEKFSGTQVARVDEDGVFTVSSVSRGGPWAIGGSKFNVTAELLKGSKVVSKIFTFGGNIQGATEFSEMPRFLGKIGLLVVPGVSIPLQVLAVEGGQKIDFMSVKEWYPDSYNHSVHGRLAMWYRPDASSGSVFLPVLLKYESGSLKSDSDLVWALPQSEESGLISVELDVSANVGLMKTGERYRYVSKSFKSKAEMHVDYELEIPSSLVSEIAPNGIIEIDISK